MIGAMLLPLLLAVQTAPAVAPSGPADGRVGTKRERETRELERLKVIPRSGSLGLDAFVFYS